MVTKQQQLEWLAKNLEKWNSGYDFAVVDKCSDGGFYVRWPSVCSSGITKKEWQQEREKMQKQAAQPVQPAQDNSWHERGELPPVGCECEYKPVNDWVKCKVLFAGDSLYVLGVQEFEICVRVLDVDFRPIRAEREKAIDEIAASIGANFRFEGYDLHARITRSLSEVIYDAGYRKVNP